MEAERQEESKLHPNLSVEEKLYFGSVVVGFVASGGASFAYVPHESFAEGNPNDEVLKKISIDRLQPAYSNLILPAIPAVDVVPTSTDNKNAPSSLLPELFRQPLLKSEEGSPVAVGVQSGRRSALLKTDGKWHRLKGMHPTLFRLCATRKLTLPPWLGASGCGDLYAGFPVRRVEDRPEECVEIRGCTFVHTASRELYMCDVINGLLKQHNLPISNTPLGWFEYDIPDAPYPSVKRCCALYETKGERRLGDHVIVGLENALPLLLQNRLDLTSLLRQFEERRKQTEGSVTSVVETWLCAVTDCDLGNYADIYSYHLDERAPLDSEALTKLGLTIPEEFRTLWSEAAAQLERELAKKDAAVGSLLAYLYWRFGREAGTIQRLLRTNDISWGTYTDPLGTHCNAHPNNFVLLPEGESAHHFLAPMDFDMAFTRRTFNRDEAQYSEWMALEDRALKMALAGDENLSSGMTGVARLDSDFTILKWALRDTMVLGFTSGFEGADDIHPPLPELSAAAHALIKLALILTAHVIA